MLACALNPREIGARALSSRKARVAPVLFGRQVLKTPMRLHKSGDIEPAGRSEVDGGK